MQQDKNTARHLQNGSENNYSEVSNHRPLPNDFCNFLPWACNQYQLENVVVITKVIQNEYLSVSHIDKVKRTKSMTKQTASRRDIMSSSNGKEEKSDDVLQVLYAHKAIRITAYCDVQGNIVELRFSKNIYIPRLIFKIMAIIIKYHIYLTRITINSGIDKYTIYEMEKFLYLTNITELCLDNSFFPEANYDLLFGDRTKIKYLSLARCKIDDTVLGNISKQLIYPLPASKCLSILILTSNKITDKGILLLGEALRSNRHLCYISLADNSITDDGVISLLDTLTEFLLTKEEVIAERGRYVRFLKDKSEMVNDMVKELRAGEFDKRTPKRKPGRPATPASPAPKKGKLEKEGSVKSLGDSQNRSNPNLDYLFYDKAVNLVKEKHGEFSDPFSSQNILVKDGMMYCYGNNTVNYLNVAYNNISHIALNKLLGVLMYQKLLDRKPRGLVSLCIEGNNLPFSCKELSQVEDILTAGLMSTDRKMSTTRKKGMSRNTPR